MRKRLLGPLMLTVALGGCAAERPAAVGEPVPGYAATSLSGETVRLEELRGQAVLLNVWATWCPPCREEMPGLEALHREMGARGLRVVGVSVDAARDREAVAGFREEHGITFALLHDPEGRVARTFGTSGVPETFLIDPDGVLARRWIGKIDARSPSVREAVRRALVGARGAE